MLCFLLSEISQFLVHRGQICNIKQKILYEGKALSSMWMVLDVSLLETCEMRLVKSCGKEVKM